MPTAAGGEGEDEGWSGWRLSGWWLDARVAGGGMHGLVGDR